MRSVPALLVLLCFGCNQENGLHRILTPPDVAIVTPEEGETWRQGAGDLAFSGTATDSYDKPKGLKAFWTVDDGEEVRADVADDGSVPLALDPEPLSLGGHTLALRVVDTDGQEGTAEVNWILDGAFEGPVVDIFAPGDGDVFAPADEIGFRATATDNNTAPDDLTWAWSSSIDGPLDGAVSADGTSVLFASLSLGVHLVTLTVTDRDGETGTDSITVEVSDGGGTSTTIATTVDPPVVDAQVGDLVFSELNVNPILVEDTLGEWVELYNTSSSPIQIQGYAFHDLGSDSYTIPDSAVVPPFSYFVLCASTDPLVNGHVPCDLGFNRTQMGGPGAMALGNNGDEVVLSRPDGLVIDQVLYNGTWFTPGAATGLDPTKLDAANNDDETMWCDQVTQIPGGELGTPGAVNDPCAF